MAGQPCITSDQVNICDQFSYCKCVSTNNCVCALLPTQVCRARKGEREERRGGEWK